MGAYTIQLPEGITWTPRFVHSIDQEKCIGCGRCYKVCGRNVLSLQGMTEDGELVPVDAEGLDDDEEFERKVMTIVNKSSCIGCEACSRICPKGCYTHSTADI